MRGEKITFDDYEENFHRANNHQYVHMNEAGQIVWTGGAFVPNDCNPFCFEWVEFRNWYIYKPQEQEQEYVDIEIVESCGKLYARHDMVSQAVYLWANDASFMGFVYEGGNVRNHLIVYIRDGLVSNRKIEGSKMVRATHIRLKGN